MSRRSPNAVVADTLREHQRLQRKCASLTSQVRSARATLVNIIEADPDSAAAERAQKGIAEMIEFEIMPF